VFRSEAVKAQQKKLHGDVFLTQPLPFSVLSGVLCAIVLLAGVFIVAGSYARSEHVAGYLVPSKGLVKIQARQFGTLESMRVREGDLVHKGQPLAEVLVSATADDGKNVAAKALAAIEQQRLTLEAQKVLEQNMLEAELAKLQSEQRETMLSINSLEAQIKLQAQITSSAEDAYKDVQDLLGKGYISKIESERRRQSWLSHQAQMQMREQDLASAKARLQQLSIRLTQLPDESDQRLARLRAQLAELDGRIAELEGRRAYLVSSPVEGRVVAVSGTGVGRTVQAGQPLLTILPEGSELKAELYVPSRAVGFVEEGQEVRLLYDAFPYQRFGSFPAVITKVTETILSPDEAMAPFEIREPVYRVTAAIESDTIQARGREVTLQSGMALKANIVLERRSFLDWILEPLRAVGERS